MIEVDLSDLADSASATYSTRECRDYDHFIFRGIVRNTCFLVLIVIKIFIDFEK